MGGDLSGSPPASSPISSTPRHTRYAPNPRSRTFRTVKNVRRLRRSSAVHAVAQAAGRSRRPARPPATAAALPSCSICSEEEQRRLQALAYDDHERVSEEGGSAAGRRQDPPADVVTQPRSPTAHPDDHQPRTAAAPSISWRPRTRPLPSPRARRPCEQGGSRHRADGPRCRGDAAAAQIDRAPWADRARATIARSRPTSSAAS